MCLHGMLLNQNQRVLAQSNNNFPVNYAQCIVGLWGHVFKCTVVNHTKVMSILNSRPNLGSFFRCVVLLRGAIQRRLSCKLPLGMFYELCETYMHMLITSNNVLLAPGWTWVASCSVLYRYFQKKLQRVLLGGSFVTARLTRAGTDREVDGQANWAAEQAGTSLFSCSDLSGTGRWTALSLPAVHLPVSSTQVCVRSASQKLCQQKAISGTRFICPTLIQGGQTNRSWAFSTDLL